MASVSWGLCVAGSVVASIVTYWGVGGLVHAWYYRRQRARAADWKLQPARFLTPALSRHAFLLGSFNLGLGALVGGSFAWYLARGGSSAIYFDLRRHGLWYLPLSALLLYFAIDAGLYYSHRLLHARALFRHVHRWHHRYVAPTVFTTLAMHPVEFVIFTSMLLWPAFFIPLHVGVYVGVIGYTYFIGMLDHSGVRSSLPLPLHAGNRFHDDHHVAFHCNYGHHTTLFDRLHRTMRRTDRRYGEHIYNDGRDHGGAEVIAAREGARA